MKTAIMGMDNERGWIVCEAVRIMLRPTRGSCGVSGQAARVQVGSADSKCSLLADGGGGVSARK